MVTLHHTFTLRKIDLTHFCFPLSNFEFPLITKAGARIEVLLNATTRRNEHGRIIGVVGKHSI